MGYKIHRIKLVCSFLVILTSACVNDRNFESPENTCTSKLTVTSTYAEVKSLYNYDTIQIQEDLVIEGYVISSDAAGNFFSVLHFQDNSINPTEGFQLEIDVRDTHLFYPEGSKIYIKLKGLYLGQSQDVFKLGGVFTSFGNESVGRLPAAIVDQHIFISCDDVVTIEPQEFFINEIQHIHTNTLVELKDVEILEEELGLPFSIEREETERTLIDCNDNEIVLLNSGFSDFQSEMLPEKNGDVIGVLLRENDEYQLAVRTLEDVDFNNDPCEELIDEFTSSAIFISELADPNNNTGARFVELYNAGNEPLSLKGWQLQRYTNANNELSSSIDLSDILINAESTLVISPDATEFELVYGFAPDVVVGVNSPADSNGDDNLALVDPFGDIVDIFGLIGEDGSGTNHEFEDGRAVRNSNIIEANSTYTFSEWTIYNDSGDSDTINQVQNAPDDFTPGVRD